MIWFANRAERRGARALARYWDDVLDRSPALPVPPIEAEPVTAAIVRRLQTLETRDASRPAYEASLLGQLLATYEMESTVSTAIVSRPGETAGRTPARAGTPYQPRRTITRRALPAIGILVAAAILLAIVAGIWLASNPNDDVRVIQPAATPSVENTPVDDGSNFPTYRGNSGRTGVVNAPGPMGSPVELWSLTGVPAAFTWSSAIVDGVLYAGVDAGLMAVDALSGEHLWTFETSLPIDSPATVGHGLVYFADINGTLYAVDIATQTELWRMDGVRPASGVALWGDLLYTVTPEGTFNAVDAVSGEVTWSVELGAGAAGAPAVADGVALQNTLDLTIHAFDALTGAELWTFSGGGTGGMATPTITNGTVYATTDGDTNNMYALDLRTGEVRWKIDREVGQAFISATATDQRIYSISEDGVLHSLNSEDGSELWTYQLGGFVRTVPLLAANVVYTVDNAGFMRAISAETGHEIWSVPVVGEFSFALSLAGETVYTGTDIGNLYAITGSDSYITMINAGLVEPHDEAAEQASPVNADGFDASAIELVWRSGSEAGLSNGLCGGAISPLNGRIYSVDCFSSAIMIFEPDGTFVERWGVYGTEPGQFRFDAPGSPYYSAGIDFDADGNIYVFDGLNDRIQKFSPEREFILAWGERGTEPGQFFTPDGRVDRVNERVYVADLQNNRIQVFDLDGNFISMWGELGVEAGDLYSSSLALAGDGTLFTSSEQRPRITHFTVDGELIEVWAEGPDGIGFTWAMTVDADGNLWAASADRGIIHVFSPEGELLGTITQIPDVGPVNGPSGLVFDDEGFLIVALDAYGVVKLDVSGVIGD
ncbi:MAG: PQQ-binding-like beta-propeller repeat protein [Thermomicrobiales bacterium]|nr:PQQ-binding-like beta-propeller repeat protein [Thermomicrobiales bacterium]